MERRRVTPNGVEIFTYNNQNIHSFCLCLYVKAGSMYETKENNGISHFFEHIVFRNIHYLMGETLYQQLDRLGLEFNATTYKEFIQFIITGAPQHFNEAADILTKIFAPISLSEKEIDVERRRIKAEIREDDEEDTLSYFTKKKAWKGTSLAYTITGDKKSLNKIRKKELAAFQEEVLSVDNIFFYVSGNMQEDAMDYLTNQIAGYSIGTKPLKREDIAPVPVDFFHRSGKVYHKKSKKIAVSFTVDIDASRYTEAELNLLFDILFEGDFCKIHQELSEKRGYVYSYDPSFEQYKNIAQINFIYEVQAKNLIPSVEAVLAIWKKMKTEITDELSYATPYYIDNAHGLLDRPEDFNWVRAYECHILGYYYKTIDDRIDSYKNVTAKRMTQICQEVFYKENVFVTMEGPKKKLPLEEVESLLGTLDEQDSRKDN